MDYNGWTNYETWRVHLDLTNNGEEIYNRFCAFMDDHITAKKSKEDTSKRLEQWVLGLYFPIWRIYRLNYRDEYMLAYDIMQRFFLCVNWLEIVESYWSDKESENDYTNGK